MLKKISPEIYYLQGNTHKVITSELVDFLKEAAVHAPRNRCRICLHEDPQDLIHEMIIAHTKDVFVPPHQHLNRTETFTLLSGETTVYFLDEQGNPQHSFKMSDINRGGCLSLVVPKGQWHTQIFESEVVIFYEVTAGPFDPSQSKNLWDITAAHHAILKDKFLANLSAYKQII